MEQAAKKKNVGRRILRIVLKTVLWIFLLIVVLFLLLLTPPVQSFVAKKATNYLEKKLQTRVSIKKLYFTLSGKIAVDQFYIEDRQKDTLLSAGKLRVDMDLMKLLFGGNELNIHSVLLEDATAKIRRTAIDTSFNFQFIAKAFGTSSPDSIQVSSDSSATMGIDIGTVELNRVRFIYSDVVTGNELDSYLGHFDTKIEKFDIDKLHFIIPQTNISGLTAKFMQVTPLVIIPPEIIKEVKQEQGTTTASPTLQMEFGEISVQKSLLDYRDSIGAMYALVDLGNLNIKPRKFDLDDQIFDMGEVLLEETRAVVKQDKRIISPEKVQMKKEIERKDTSTVEVPFPSFLATNLNLRDIEIQYDDNNAPRQQQGMDYAHLKATVPVLEANQFVFSADSIGGRITRASLREQSGFELQELKTDFLYSNNQTYLHDLYLKTPGTELKRDITLRYASIDAMANDIANLQIDADIQDGRIAARDILTFVPVLRSQPAFSNPNAIWYLDTRITGRIGDLRIDRLKATGLSGTKLDLNGRITGLPDPDRFNANLNIRQLTSSKADVLSFIPANTIPSNITLPSRFDLRGKFNGGMEKMNTDLVLTTDLGNIALKGTLQDIANPKTAYYDVVAHTTSLDLRTILQDTTLGPVTMDLTAKGRGYDPKTAEGSFNGVIRSMVYNKYNYQQLEFNGTIANHLLDIDAAMQDPNLSFTLNGSADITGDFPKDLKLSMMIDSLKAKELNLTADILNYHGKIEADFADANPDNLIGKLFITESVLLEGTQRIALDTVKLDAGKSGDTSYLYFESDVATARMQGKYKLTELPGIMSRTIEPYYSLGMDTINNVISPYDFTLNASLIDRPLVRSLIPGLEKAVNVRLTSHFSNEIGFDGNLSATDLAMQGVEVKGMNVKMITTDSALNVNAQALQIKSGSTIVLDSTFLVASVANNTIDFGLDIKDKQQKDKFSVGGILKQADNGDLVFSLKPDDFLLKYEPWAVARENRITIGANGGVNANNFTLSRQGQQLSINSTSADLNAPINVKLDNLHLSTFTAMFMSDSTIVDGVVNGQIELKDLMTNPAFTGNLDVRDFSYHSDTLGNINAKVENRSANVYGGVVKLSGRGNDAVIEGSYNAESASFDATMNLNKLPMKTIEILSNGSLRYATGDLNGRFKISGTVDKPVIVGDLNFDKTAFNIAMLNSYFAIDNEKIRIDEKGITFNRFQIKDSVGNNLTLNGILATNNFVNYNFDLAINATDFKALNSTRKDNKLFWGQLYFTTNLRVKGTEAAPAIDGRLTVNEKTKMTVTLPQSDPGVANREGIIEFVDMDAPNTDSLFMASVDSLNRSILVGMDISVNVDVNKAAEFTIIIDEGNGDFLNLKGSAQINTGIDPSGKINMVGTYEVEEGAYELSFNLIRRKFDITRGSKITWQGEPTDAILDLTARYIAKAAPYDLVKGQIANEDAVKNFYLQRLPFDVLLKMEGQLMKPVITFDIVLPTNQNYGGVDAGVLNETRLKLEQLRQTPGDMNKQVFSLLLLNRFVSDNPFASTSSDNYASNMVRQSVSALMADQLNRLAEGLISGVDINFGIESTDDYTSGERESRTDLNVGVSKKLLNDRLTVTVGSDITLEGPQTSNNQSMIGGNVAVDYALSADGRYKIRAYTTNDYQGVVDGYVVESGIGFIITLDYNKFREIFMSRKKMEAERKKRREQRQKEQQQQEQQQQKTSSTNN